jgi:predicted Zn-dependent protease
VLSNYHDPRLFAIGDEQLVEAGWKVIAGGLGAFTASSRLAELARTEAGLRRIGLILGGDVIIRQESVAIASSHMPRAQTDESAYMTSSATAMVEAHEAKGSGWTTCARLDDFTDETGSEAAANAIAAIGGRRAPTGTTRSSSAPARPTLNNLVLPACHGAFYASSTPFLGRLGRAVAVPELGIYDHGALPGLIGSKGITCEGLPTGRTDLIKDGVLVGLLSHWYDAQRLLHDPRVADKLGVEGPPAARALVPRNGFRYDGGGRSFERRPSTSACNVMIESGRPVSFEELIREVKDGLYIGRIWYTYPINGLRAGDFTCTVVGDSFIIRDGRITAPIRANAIRINDNVTRLLQSVVGVTKDVKGTMVWAADEVVYTPELAVSGVHVDEIAGSGRD